MHVQQQILLPWWSGVGLVARLWVIKTWIIRRITITIAIMTRVGESVYNICFKSYCNQNKFGNKGNFSNSSLFFSQSVVTTLPHESWALQLSAPSAAAACLWCCTIPTICPCAGPHTRHVSHVWPCLEQVAFTCNWDICQHPFIIKLSYEVSAFFKYCTLHSINRQTSLTCLPDTSRLHLSQNIQFPTGSRKRPPLVCRDAIMDSRYIGTEESAAKNLN